MQWIVRRGIEFYDGVLFPDWSMHIAIWSSPIYVERLDGDVVLPVLPMPYRQVRHEATESERRAVSGYWQSRMEHDGVVAVGDICNGDSTFGIKSHSPIHYYNFIEGFGLKTTDFGFSIG